MASELDRMARKIDTLEKQVADIRAKERPSYASGFLADLSLYPHLRGLWSFAATDNSENIIDVSGNNNPLFAVGTPTFGTINYRQPYAILNGTSQYYSRAGIHFPAGFTLGGWFYMNDATPASDNTFISKYYTTGNQRSYLLNYSVAFTGLHFTISSDGTATTLVKSTIAPADATWYFICGRFTPSTSLDIFVNNTKTSNTTSIPASVYNSSAYFMVGTIQDISSLLAGRASLMFAFASALADNQIGYIYQKTRPMFGV